MILFRVLKPTVLTCLLCSFVAVSFAHQGSRYCSRALAPTGGKVLWPDAPKRPFDVQKYQLTLDWRPIFENRSQKYTGTNIISLQVTQTTPNITLDAGLLRIDSIRINGVKITPTPQPTVDEQLIIPLPQQLQNSGSQVVLSIDYRKDTLVNQGIYFFPKGTHDPNDNTNTTEDLAYTMSEPTDAHYWMPCMDQPYDKAESEISIIVPNGIETGSNGTLLGKVAYTPTSTIWHWKSDEPIATYLMVADASTFIHWSETHNRSAAPGDTVHLDFYAWPSDYYQDSIKDGSVYNATYFLQNTSQIMSWLEAKYGGFPFVKYGQVPVQPFSYGGMEHQTITTLHRRWLRGDDEGIAHEMAHQWFGDKTTCETFKDIWLNEGFATYSQAIWGEAWGGYKQYMGILKGDAGWYIYDTASSKYATYDPPADDLFNFARTYCKGACVLHMLRRMVNNDTMFFGALHDYSNAFAYTTVNTAQFRDYMSSRLGIDLNEYIDEWIFGPLYPSYDIKWAQNGSNKFFLRINQDQTIRDHFTMPVKLFAFHGGSTDTLTFENNSRSQGFQKNLSYFVDSLKFDEDALLLSTYITASGDTVNISQKVHSKLLRNSPELAVNPTAETRSLFNASIENGVLLCRFSPFAFPGILELYNSVGMKISSVPVLEGENQKVVDIRNLSTGIYFVHFAGENIGEVHNVTILK